MPLDLRESGFSSVEIRPDRIVPVRTKNGHYGLRYSTKLNNRLNEAETTAKGYQPSATKYLGFILLSFVLIAYGLSGVFSANGHHHLTHHLRLKLIIRQIGYVTHFFFLCALHRCEGRVVWQQAV